MALKVSKLQRYSLSNYSNAVIFDESSGDCFLYNKDAGEIDMVVGGMTAQKAQDLLILSEWGQTDESSFDRVCRKYGIYDVDEVFGSVGDMESWAEVLAELGVIPGINYCDIFPGDRETVFDLFNNR